MKSILLLILFISINVYSEPNIKPKGINNTWYKSIPGDAKFCEIQFYGDLNVDFSCDGRKVVSRMFVTNNSRFVEVVSRALYYFNLKGYSPLSCSDYYDDWKIRKSCTLMKR